ncbi:unnamed protein product [Rhizophagus irregularis]|nr:unnamed protein product [Rhizophagus irregularis]
METKILENVEHQLMDMEHDDPNTKHQSENVIPESSTKNFQKSSTTLNIKTIPYTPKEKECVVTFAKMAFRNLDVGSNYDTSPTPSSIRLKKNVTKCMASDSKVQPAKKKQ